VTHWGPWLRALSEINCSTTSLSSLHLFYDTIEAHIRGLTALGKAEDSYETMLVPVILGKLPSDVHKNLVWEHGNAAWTITELRNAIWKEITILECGSLTYKGKTMDPHQSTLTTVQLSSKVTSERIWNACGTHARRVHARAKPRDKAATRCTWVPHPFFTRRGRVRNACQTRLKCVRTLPCSWAVLYYTTCWCKWTSIPTY